MSHRKAKVMVNGFGRIGRILTRHLVSSNNVEVVAINDLVGDISNLAYLYNYDSHYGKSVDKAIASENRIKIAGNTIDCYQEPSLKDIPWNQVNVDIVIDATGVHQNIIDAQELTRTKEINFFVTTHAPKKDVDIHVIMGANDDELDLEKHKVIASSICDANAIIHPITAIEDEFGIESGTVTTLHPWLSYQNLVDGPLVSQSNPAHFWKDYSLGRSSVGSFIPKDTTAVKALEFVKKGINNKVTGFSYRLPTGVVCSADMTLVLEQDADIQTVKSYIQSKFKNSKYVRLNEESLISKDYEAEEASCVIDMQWLNVTNKRLLKLVCWYDNEWGYSARVKDLVEKIAEGSK